MKSTIMYAGEAHGRLFHFYPNAFLIKSVCGCKDAVKVRVTETHKETPETYWAWWDNKSNRFTMVYPAKLHLEICFPYGLESAEKTGEGQAMPVTIEVLEKVDG